MTACDNIEFKYQATSLTDGVKYDNSSGYDYIGVAQPTDGVWEINNGNLVPGTYPTADATTEGDPELMKIYKSANSFGIGNDENGNLIPFKGDTPLASTDYHTFTVTAPADKKVTLKPGKITTLTIRVGAASATLESVTVSDLTQGEAISGGGNATESYRTLGQLGTMSAGDIAALPTKWIVTDKDLSAEATWGGSYYSNGYMMLAEMMESYYTASGEAKKSIDLVLPYATTEIGESGFGNPSGDDRYGLKSLTAPNVTGSIGKNAFQSCKSLTAVSLPNAAESIRNYAFYGCTSLATVNLPKVTESIGNAAFRNCESLATVNLPGVTGNIGNDAFRNCTNLTTVSLPNAKGSIGNYAFYNCENLAAVSLPGVTGSIREAAFYYCTKLTALTIGGEITAWGAYVLNATPTSNIALTLSASQKAVASGGGDTGDAATFSDTDLYSASTDYTGSPQRFAGYTFKSITLK